MSEQRDLLGMVPSLPVRVCWCEPVMQEWHSHRELELAFLLRGKAEIECESGRRPLMPGRVELINPMEMHTFSSDDAGAQLLVMKLDLQFFSGLWPGIETTRFTLGDQNDFRKEHEHLYQLFARMIQEAHELRRGSLLRLSVLSGQLMYLLMDAFADERPQAQRQQETHGRFEQLINYIDAHYAEHWSLDDLAAQMCITPQYLSRYFHKRMGMPLSQYINRVRAQKSLADVIRGDLTAEDISQRHGFSSLSAYYKAFRNTFDCAPNQYRKRYFVALQPESEKDFAADLQGAIATLLTYVPKHDQFAWEVPHFVTHPHRIDLTLPGKPLHKSWAGMCCYSNAYENPAYEWRVQLQMVQDHIPFTYIRCVGILSDHMHVCARGAHGRITYNFSHICRLLDFLLSVNLRPFLELNFMPEALASNPSARIAGRGNISPPRDMGEWEAFITALFEHLIQRYGKKRILSWKFVIWHAPGNHEFWSGTWEEFFVFFARTYRVIKSIDPRFEVGGCGFLWTALPYGWFDAFITYAREHAALPDFITIHLYSVKSKTGHITSKVPSFADEDSILSPDENLFIGSADCCRREVLMVREQMDALGLLQTPLIVSRFNVSPFHNDLLHDTCFMGAFWVKNALELWDLADCIGFSDFSDFSEDSIRSPGLFHGGLGLITTDGVCKSVYHATMFLNRLGDMVLSQDDGYIVTRKGDGTYQILCYHYVHFNSRYLSFQPRPPVSGDRYEIFEQKNSLVRNFELHGLKGRFRLKYHRINRGAGSAYDTWMRMGQPSYYDPDLTALLNAKSLPDFLCKCEHFDGDAKIHVLLEPHEICLIEIEPFYHVPSKTLAPT